MTNKTENTSVANMDESINVVARKVREFQQKRQIDLPPDYSAENAMKSAWLMLQNTVDKDKKPVLSVCTKHSVINALLDMVIQGLNPAKKQCYFIAYGKQLVCQRSYFGSMAVTKRVAGAREISAQVVYKGDEFSYEIKGARKSIIKHVQRIENIDNNNIIAAYCIIEFGDDRPAHTEIMTIEQIKKAWSKSKMNPEKDGSTHKEFAEEMAKKTVINRACKAYINSSSDASLFMQSFNRADEIAAEAEVEEEIEENANGEVIDIEADADEYEPDPEPEPEPEGEPEPEPEQKAQKKSARGNGEPQSLVEDGPPF